MSMIVSKDFYRFVNECHLNKKRGSGALFICPKTNRVLLNLRSSNKSHKLTWSIWGGMIENSESPMECLEREILEEIGFTPTIKKIQPFDIFQSKDKNFVYYSFICVVENEFIPILNKENIGYTWIELGFWPRPLHEGVRHSFCSQKSMEKLQLIVSTNK